MQHTKTDPIKTVFIISMGFLVLYFIFKIYWFIIAALVIGVLGLASPYLSKKIDFLWMKLAMVLGFIVPNILLSIIFYLFLYPLTLLAKLFGKKDPLKLKNTNSSVYEISNIAFGKKNLENPW